MKQVLSLVSLVVEDYDEAVEFFVGKLGFELLEDTRLTEEKRWVRIAPRNAGHPGCAVLLAKANNDAQRLAIGHQAGGRVFLFLQTDNFERDYSRYRQAGVVFREEPRNEAYGRVVVFEDLYGNPWDLFEPKDGSGD